MPDPGPLPRLPMMSLGTLHAWLWPGATAAAMEAHRRGTQRALDEGRRRLEQAAATYGRNLAAATTEGERLAAFNELTAAQNKISGEMQATMEAFFTPGQGLKLKGDAALQQEYLGLLRSEMLRSPSFNVLMMTLNADGGHPVEVTVGRNLDGVLVDNFDTALGFTGQQRIDLADVKRLPVDPPQAYPGAITQGELLVHAMTEAREGALGVSYGAAHATAIDAENRYRDERGQPGHRRMPPFAGGINRAGNWDVKFDNGYLEIWTLQGKSIDGINRL